MVKTDYEVCSSFNTIRLNDEDDQKRQLTLRRLKIASMICAAFLVIEVIGGLISGSLSILSDATHLFADFASFIIAIFASKLASRPPSSVYTYGYKRVELLGALFSVGSLFLACTLLFVESLRRFYSMSMFDSNDLTKNDGVNGKVMSSIAGIGIGVNIALAFVLGDDHAHLPGHSHDHDHDHDLDHDHDRDHNHFDQTDVEKEKCCLIIDDNASEATPFTIASFGHSHHSHHHDHSNVSVQNRTCDHFNSREQTSKRNVNLSAAYAHVLGDLIMSLAVFIAGIIIWINPKLQIVDPICTCLFCIFVFKSTKSVIKSSIGVLMEETPPDIDYNELYDSIKAVKGVENVHDLHIWSISYDVPAMSVHVMVNDSVLSSNEVLKDINRICGSKFGIHHSTTQIQTFSDEIGCITCDDHLH